VLPDGTREVIEHALHDEPGAVTVAAPAHSLALADGPSTIRPLGDVTGARSGDKGGNANVGVWTWRDDAYAWLAATLTVDRFKELVPEALELEVRRYELANLRALNFVVVGILGNGVASSTRYDPQAKGLGEYLRSRHLEIPDAIVGS
jgi:hypothetical protein